MLFGLAHRGWPNNLGTSHRNSLHYATGDFFDVVRIATPDGCSATAKADIRERHDSFALIEPVVDAYPHNVIPNFILDIERVTVVIDGIYRLLAEVNVQIFDLHRPMVRYFSF